MVLSARLCRELPLLRFFALRPIPRVFLVRSAFALLRRWFRHLALPLTGFCSSRGEVRWRGTHKGGLLYLGPSGRRLASGWRLGG